MIFTNILKLIFTETLSEAVKMLKGEYCVKAIDTHKMDKALVFCRTKMDCDNMENYFNQIGKFLCFNGMTCNASPVVFSLFDLNLCRQTNQVSCGRKNLHHPLTAYVIKASKLTMFCSSTLIL